MAGKRKVSKTDYRKLAHELQVHQVELEMQNRELQEARHQLEESRDRYADLYDFAPIAYVTLNVQGVIREINLAGARLLGQERTYLIGKPFAFWVSKPDSTRFRGYLSRCRSLPDETLDQILLSIPGRGKVPVQLLSSGIGSGGAKGGTLIRTAIFDLTERKRSEDERMRLYEEQSKRAEFEEANRSKDEFLATLSHELRTPLQAILSWTEMMRSGKVPPAQFDRGLKIIHQCARSQQQLISDLLDVSRAIAGKIRLDIRPVSLPSLIQQSLDGFMPQLQEKKLHLLSEIEPAAAWVAGDAGRLHQILSNLLSNAVKFTPEGGTLTLRLKKVQAGRRVFACLSLTDTGKGIKAATLPHLFERFRQEDSSSTRSHAGLGLGLSIVRFLAELHGGQVKAESPGEGKGTTITVTLPLLGDADRRALVLKTGLAAGASPESEEDRLDQVKILLVDDDQRTLESLAFALEGKGARVQTAESSQSALSCLRRSRPDVLITDIAMPGEDGFRLLEQVRELGPRNGGKVPVIALTAHAGAEDRDRALASGFRYFVTKPVQISDLVRVVSRAKRPSS